MRHALLAMLVLFSATNVFCVEKAPDAPAKGALSFPIAMDNNVDMFRKYFPIDDTFFIRLTYAETFSPISMASSVKVEAGACCGAPETMHSSGCLSTLFEGPVGVLNRLDVDKRKGEVTLRTLEFDMATSDFTTPTLRKFPFTFTCK